jgi:hypothetical protein
MFNWSQYVHPVDHTWNEVETYGSTYAEEANDVLAQIEVIKRSADALVAIDSFPSKTFSEIKKSLVASMELASRNINELCGIPEEKSDTEV